MVDFPLQSSVGDWNSRSKTWSMLVSGRNQVAAELAEVKSLVLQAGDIGNVNILYNLEDIMKVDQKMHALDTFAANIHQEINSKIDDLFTRQMQGFSDVCYKLNPNHYELDADNSKAGITVHIAELVVKAPIDCSLMMSYVTKLLTLNLDKPSDDAKWAYRDDLWQWHNKVTFEDLKAIEQIMYGAQRSIITSDKTVLSTANYAAELMYELSPNLVIRNNAYTNTAEYRYYRSGIYLNMASQAEFPRGAYYTYFHEMGHMIDNTLPELVQGQNTNETHEQYISIGFGSLSDQFYQHLNSDVQGYLDDYNSRNGTELTSFDVDAAVHEELLSSDIRSEFSDLFGAVTHNRVFGRWHHPDDYWKYNSTGEPSLDALNKEAFAHFTHMSMTLNQSDIDDLQRFFPNAYETYMSMLKEAKETLDASRI